MKGLGLLGEGPLPGAESRRRRRTRPLAWAVGWHPLTHILTTAITTIIAAACGPWTLSSYSGYAGP